jgi:hypothetical protein
MFLRTLELRPFSYRIHLIYHKTSKFVKIFRKNPGIQKNANYLLVYKTKQQIKTQHYGNSN